MQTETVDRARLRVERTLSRVQKGSPKRAEMPTVERMLQAGGNAKLGHAVDSVQLERDGQLHAEQIKIPRVRFDDDPFERLAKRGQLSGEADEAINALKASAGRRYRSIHHRAGLEPIRGFDPSKGFTTRGGGGLLGSEKRCDAFDEWDRATSALTPWLRPWVNMIVLEGESPEETGRRLGSYTDRKICIAVALSFLRQGLRELAKHFDVVDREAAVLS